jgi:hypothetical protein
MLLIKKKDKTLRLCVDYRSLNKVKLQFIIKLDLVHLNPLTHKYLLPRIDDVLYISMVLRSFPRWT